MARLTPRRTIDPEASGRQHVPPEFERALRELGLADGSGPVVGQPLTGGVSSDIWRVEVRGGPICAKRALPKLRVAADWHAPIERNLYEARWLQWADRAAPGSAPRMLGQHPGFGVLAMSFLPEATHRVWKQQLRQGEIDESAAREVGRVLARIHAYTAARPHCAADFDTDAIFFDIRLEPYLVAAASRHPDLADSLQSLVRQTQAHKRALVHGDVSPKNILIGPQGPVLLDAECAWWGDPAFDLAFCLNHLLLKCVWVPQAAPALARCFEALAQAYRDGVDWEPLDALEARAAALLPGLLLARVDGKSPVEYLQTESQRDRVRRCAAPLLRAPVRRLAEVLGAWQRSLGA